MVKRLLGSYVRCSVLVSLCLLMVVGITRVAYAVDGDSKYCIYSEPSFAGESYCGDDNNSWLGYFWVKNISSIDVKQGYEVVAFRQYGYWGGHEVFSGENTDLGNWNNRIRSFYVRPARAEQDKACFYARKNYKGRRFCTNNDQRLLFWIWNNRISSVSVPAGKEVTLYSRWFFNGQSLVLTASTPDLGDFNNATSSLKIDDAAQNIDADGDGVDDSLDQCPDTPLGEMVNEVGCAPSQLDSDNDGVTDDVDQCPDTGAGKPVDQNGCANDQLDTDGDGVNNELDQCPNTPPGEAVDVNGCGASQLDEDGDSVSDADDQCPATPPGEAVDANGCALSQLDSDSDGVTDNIDECPDTPAGEQVNEEGCSQTQLDDDEDGVNNAIDQCPDTPAGESANENGCAPSQLDSDNDGVNDALDLCPATPEGLPVNTNGCALIQLDTDNDGVNDALDICPATPAGEAVNAQGCAPSQLDTDSDGVNDALDQCPSTPADETANSEGCAPSQLDSDNDGANDAIDQCPNTPADETANTDGCSPSQLDTDNDGVSDDIDLCPNTPADETPNAEGCALSQLDSDNDGANDAIDQCPNTPVGETANADGCALSQLDTDSDGVNDALDQCPSTPEGQSVNAEGCALSQLDSDSDSVTDDLDQCPNTPAGETVNADGCALTQLDTDNDGVNDANDQCPATPSGEAANAEGCAPSQLDTDNDGVNDAIDQCPGTPAGDTPNAEGCSPDQIDTDGDGTPDYLDAFPNDPNETSDLDGDGIGDNADTDRDGDGVANDVDAFPNDPAETTDTDGDGVGDNSDPDIDGDGVPNVDDYFPTDPTASTVPSVQITSPATLITVGSSPLRITGTVDDLNARIIVNGIEIPQNSGSFEADVVIEEGANNIIVRAIDDKNHEGTATITVSLDKTPPYITVQSPKDGGKVFNDTISVSGLVNDIVRGTVSEDEANVQVAGPLGNSVAAVSNRSYLAENVQLQVGENQISITAADAVGNVNTETITVTYEPQTEKKIELVSGNAQTAAIQSNLAQPLIIRLSDNGQPVVNKTVVFRVTEGDGLVQPDTEAEGNGAVVTTDAQGQAQVTYRLGSRAGIGNQKVTARAVGFKGEVEFYHSATYGEGIQLGIIAGNNQRGAVRQPLPQPLVLAVTDTGANLIPNADILFEVSKGTGKFNNGETSYATTTDMDGRASASFVLGPEEGLDVQRVTAKLGGSEATAGFTISGFLPGDPGNTRISGVVLNNQDIPMPGVTVRVDNSARQAVTDSEGQFTITEAPVGPVHILVEGSTTTVPGEWPSLSYNLVTVPGVDNPMASPIYLVEIDTENAVFVGAEDTVVTHPDLPGFNLEVKGESVTFPDGSKQGNLSITRVNSNKIPMPPPNGMQPQLIVTIQPHGAVFDPPARLTLPNTDGHTPLAEIEMYSYDHDLEEFVTIGLGTVSKDGATVTSNIGSGVVKAGWHCGSAPGGNGCGHDCNYCEDCEEGTCRCVLVPDRPLLDQKPNDCFVQFCGQDPVPIDDIDRTDTELECKFCDGENGKVSKENGAECTRNSNLPNDCSKPGCRDGECHAQGGFDDEDISESDEKCAKCSEGKLVEDSTKIGNKCGDLPGQECLECKDGKCQRPDCDAAGTIFSVGIEDSPEITGVNKFVKRATKLLDRLPIPLVLDIDPVLSGSYEYGEECCKECSAEITKGNTHSVVGEVGAETKVLLGKRVSINKTDTFRVPYLGTRLIVYNFNAQATFGAGLEAKLVGGVNQNIKTGCDDESQCGVISANLSISPVAEVSVEGEEIEADWVLGVPDGWEIIEIDDVKAGAKLELGGIQGELVVFTGAKSDTFECGQDKCEYSWLEGKLEVTVQGRLDLADDFINDKELPPIKFEVGLWDAQAQGDCSE